MRIDWTPYAQADLVAIHDYIAQDSPLEAMRVVNRLIGRVRQLRTFARSGRVVPEAQDDAVRELIQTPYRVIYRVLPKRIEILTVMHGARLLRWPAGGNAPIAGTGRRRR